MELEPAGCRSALARCQNLRCRGGRGQIVEGLEGRVGELADGSTLRRVDLARLCRLNLLPWSEPCC